ncbi:MAG: CerR family C-terminal domain-containing protein [Planctomycetes bacterium]|nr:CerR family C-terminal domain-containing protein [Planctomycetota bacterium]MBU1518314.1 CerR family C-terminal domain-containing protein [Planctomycetota bacterium]MBU2457859.1 CerR family C-terminal domain-containing protein [Planctomycetota bacterium]
MAKNAENEDVRQRLLDAGEELFSEYGFNGTSTRLLTKKAECNLASVNYYFSGKYELYLEVIRKRMKYLRDLRVERISEVIAAKGEKLQLEELLRVFAESFVEPLMQDASGRRFKKMLRWEMLNPKFPVQEFIDGMIKPVMQLVVPVLKKMYPGLPDNKTVLCVVSVVSQLLHTIQMEEIFLEVKGDKFMPFDIQQHIEHIVEFSSAAIKGMSG